MRRGEICRVSTASAAGDGKATHESLSPRLHRALDSLFRIDPPPFGHIGKMFQAQVV